VKFASKKIFYSIVTILLIGGLTGLSITRANTAQSETPSISLYKKVAALAATGSREAEEKLEDLRDFLNRQGKTLEEAEETRVNRTTNVGETQVYLKGITPFYLKIYNNPNIRDLDSLDKYVESRKRVLKKLATQSPNRIISVDISPAEEISLIDFWHLRDRHGLDIDVLYLDLLVDGNWTATVCASDEDIEGKKSRVFDFSKNGADIEKQLKKVYYSTPPPPGQGTARPDPTSITYKIQHARGKIPSEKAIPLQGEPSILLVDPATDLKDAFSNKAADIYVVDMPHLYVMKRNILGKAPTPNILPQKKSGDFHGKVVVPEIPRFPQEVR
jgi:hypothetical protein